MIVFHADGSQELVDEEFVMPADDPTAEDITLDLLADHEERLCMLELMSTNE